MDIETRKQIEEFATSMRSALDMFKGQDALVKSLTDKVGWLEQRMLDTPTAALLHTGVGFQDAKLAKDFVTMVKAIYIKEDDRAKDMTEGRDPDGGYLVRPEYRDTLISIMETYGIARQRCTVIPLSTNELIMPKLTGGVQVYWIGEGQTIPQTQPAFGEFKMTIKKLAALVPMPNE